MLNNIDNLTTDELLNLYLSQNGIEDMGNYSEGYDNSNDAPSK